MYTNIEITVISVCLFIAGLVVFYVINKSFQKDEE